MVTITMAPTLVRITLIITLCLSLSGVLIRSAEEEEQPTDHMTSAATHLTWHNITRALSRGALCNDFSPAGYFIRKNPIPIPTEPNLKPDGSGDYLYPDWDSSTSPSPEPGRRDWVIYLEGGGGCVTPRECNQRYIDQRIREKFTVSQNGSRTVNVTGAWMEYGDQPLTVTSKLMTSIWRFSGMETVSERNGDEKNTSSRENRQPGPIPSPPPTSWTVEGRDILSTSKQDNPDFYAHNHVLIPYCSSDLWLKKTKNFHKATEDGFTFQFNPLEEEQHQFTFRGAAILESVVKDLFEFHGFSDAREVVLAGSSAGGVGVMNHAGWLQRELRTHADSGSRLYVLMDSAWFIDFKGEITKQFSPEEDSVIEEEVDEIINTCSPVASHGNSSDLTLGELLRKGTVACVSAPLFLSTGRFPSDVSIFTVFSRYDLYILTRVLSNFNSNDPNPLIIINLMRVVSEYSGSMNTSLHSTALLHGNLLLSYYITSCFQHVYLATSSLWGEGALFGTAAVDGEAANNRFKHTISSGVISTFHLKHLNHTSGVTTPISISMAIHTWLEKARLDASDVVQFSDSCKGPYCNEECPETVVLGDTGPYWTTLYQSIILAIVVGVVLLGVTVKISLSVKDKIVSWKQKKFLSSAGSSDDPVMESESTLPYCQDSRAISIACLNLKYSVSVKSGALKLHQANTTAKGSGLLSLANAITTGSTRRQGDSMSRGLQREGANLEMVDQDIKEDEEEETKMMDLELGRKECKKPSIKLASSLSADSESKIGLKKTEDSTSSRKEILKGISTYFNPGELVAIMGPSGCGKTTFLDLLAGRRRGDTYQGEILINGFPMDEVHNWYIFNTGYVLQLATPYYEELTVRDNLMLAAQMRLPKTLSLKIKFKRVEQVMTETGLTSLAGVKVGGAIGPGLSGGQKRRLCVAIQLLSMPSLIFLDEPTSGLDATSSLELLEHLHRVASSNRTVILTIHQPRLEIFHMFHKLVLLSDGQIAYHGIPEKVYEVFLEANKASSLPSVQPDELEIKNPADMIMDMLQSENARCAILSYYQDSDEPDAVATAITEVCRTQEPQTRQRHHQKAGMLNRLSALESRASKRSNTSQMLYLPMIFTIYGILLGSVYFQTNSPTSILSAFGVYSCASALFMFPAIYTYLYRAVEIFFLELSDGVGSPLELVLQTFFRFSSLTCIPILICSFIIYMLVIPASQYDIWVFVQITIISFALNHTWICLIIFVIMIQPGSAHRIAPVLSAVAGFAGGFFIPPSMMPVWYRWLFYINPNYYGFSAITRILLQEISLTCSSESPIECYPTSSNFLLTHFSLNAINPHLHVLALLGMSVSYLVLAWIAITLRLSYIIPRAKKIFKKKTLRRNEHNDEDISFSSNEVPLPYERLARRRSSSSTGSMIERRIMREEKSGSDNIEFKKVNIPSETPESSRKSLRNEYRRRTRQGGGTMSHMLQDGERHQVWKPGSMEGGKKSFDSPHQRKMTLVNRIKTYRGMEGDGEGINMVNIQRRLEQWKKIQEEADMEEAEMEEAEMEEAEMEEAEMEDAEMEEAEMEEAEMEDAEMEEAEMEGAEMEEEVSLAVAPSVGVVDVSVTTPKVSCVGMADSTTARQRVMFADIVAIREEEKEEVEREREEGGIVEEEERGRERKKEEGKEEEYGEERVRGGEEGESEGKEGIMVQKWRVRVEVEDTRSIHSTDIFTTPEGSSYGEDNLHGNTTFACPLQATPTINIFPPLSSNAEGVPDDVPLASLPSSKEATKSMRSDNHESESELTSVVPIGSTALRRSDSYSDVDNGGGEGGGGGGEGGESEGSYLETDL